MHLTHFTAEYFRNIARAALEPCSGVNVVFGENGQGKTSLLEAIWLFTGCRSFRCADSREMISEGQDRSQLSAYFISNAREQSAQLEITKRRNLTLNGFTEDTPRRMLGTFPAVAFTPATLSLVQGGPGERRRFLDVALCMLTPAYAVKLSKYLKALAQRNALLRHLNPDFDLLDTWDENLAMQAAQITDARLKYLDQLVPVAVEFYAGISASREQLGIGIQLTGHDYASARQTDIRRQLTTVGPHRDDLKLTLNNRSLRDFGSQGQQRTAALALKLAEATVLQQITGETPIALLDDVLSELDTRRQSDLLCYLKDWQVFLTCCEPSHALHGSAGKVFCVADGKITLSA